MLYKARRSIWIMQEMKRIAMQQLNVPQTSAFGGGCDWRLFLPSSECQTNALKDLQPAVHGLATVSYFFVAKYLGTETFQRIEKS
jgi:hypothetical protein